MDRQRGLILRDLAGVILLLALLLAGLLSAWYAGQQHEALARQLDSCAWLALSGQWQQAREEAQEVQQLWRSRWKLWASLGDHSPMEEIDALFGELTVYAAAGERTDFAQSCAALSRRLQAMADAHTLHWWNIL